MPCVQAVPEVRADVPRGQLHRRVHSVPMALGQQALAVRVQKPRRHLRTRHLRVRQTVRLQPIQQQRHLEQTVPRLLLGRSWRHGI